MKTIEPISVWDNGKTQVATILNAYAVNVTLGSSATFWYGIFVKNEDGTQGLNLSSGNLLMTGEDYAQWAVDSYAWDWVAEQLNLTITGDYIPPVPPQPEPQPETPINPAVESPAV